jgi:hypothetical protein
MKDIFQNKTYRVYANEGQYEVENKNTGVVEIECKELPKAIIYAQEAENILEVKLSHGKVKNFTA